MQKRGQGNVTSGTGCSGTLRVVASVPDVLALMREDLSEVVVFSHEASATAVTPLFPKIKGVVCTQGGATSHLAIVAREFDLACIMGCEIDYPGELDGCAVHFNAEGEIFIENR
jgi:phosphoenolpyruvate-protein kinase (PTS system EI component)